MSWTFAEERPIYWDDECSECHERGLEKDHNYCPWCGAKVVE